MVAATLDQLRREWQRRIYFRALGKIEALRQHADHGANDAVRHHRLVDNVLVRTEPALPQTISNDRDRIFAGLILFVAKTSAHNRLDAEGIEDICRHQKTLDAFWRIAARQISAPPSIKSESFE